MERSGNQEGELLKQIKKMELSIRPFLTAEALERLNNLKIAHQEKWLKAITLLYQLIASGQIRTKITSDQLKQILTKLSEREKRRPKIRFIRK
ncbi:MAG TPA: hypothetical protein EYH09_00600 [Candidatus Nanopusillus sp.]|nr:hypothetical protein [Candidatus Nanopusillus sp.]HIP89961.1 hypothetical protein [Candidatus Nanopusillus sp.]